MTNLDLIPAGGGGGARPEFFSVQVSEARRFYLNLAPSRSSRLSVVCGGREHCIPEYEIHRTTFPYYSLEFVAQGRGRVVLQGASHILRAGSVFSYGPGVRHYITTDPDDPLVKYFVDFRGGGARSMLKSCGLDPGHLLDVSAPAELIGLFEELIRNGLRARKHHEEICRRVLECIALKIAELSLATEEAESPAFLTFEKCRGHIEAHFERLRTLGQIARECHVNAAYLCRLFRRFEQQSPYQYLMRLKMGRAAERLQEPGALIKQVAEQSGFGDPFHFSRAFKGVFGISPDAFRRLR